jgi:hypothetical protein
MGSLNFDLDFIIFLFCGYLEWLFTFIIFIFLFMGKT